jgi:integrase
MNIKRSIQFRLEQRKNHGIPITENVPIRMRVTFDGKRIEFSTGYRIDECKWDESLQKVRKGCSNRQKQSYAEINASLAKYESDIQELFKEYEYSECVPSTEELRTAFVHKTQPQKMVEPVAKVSDRVDTRTDNASLLDIYDEFVEEMGRKNNWSKTSYDKFKSVKHHIADFKSNVSFSDFDEAGLNRYVQFLVQKLNMRNSTIENQIDFVRMFMRWSFRKGYHANNAFELFRPKLKSPQRKIIFLTPEELKRIMEVEIPDTKKYLERVRDVFVFMCFTGLRHSDAYNLHRSDIKGDHIEITTIKTHDSLIIELNKYSKAILDKYKDVPYKDDKALPVITNQRMNEYVKELAKLAEINEPVRMIHYEGHTRVENVFPKYELIGTHAARRTFVCSALSLGIPAQVVMKWTGHSDYKAMKPYIDIADDIRAKSMKKFNQMDNLL